MLVASYTATCTSIKCLVVCAWATCYQDTDFMLFVDN